MDVGTSTRPALFVVIPTKENYNLLLSQEWIHRVGCVPYSMNQSFFRVKVNHVDMRNFDLQLPNISPLRLQD